MAKVYDRSSRMRTISFLFLILSLTFCQKARTTIDVSIAFPSDPPSLDPLLATDLVSQKLSKFIFAGLYEFQGTMIKPRLVTSDSFYKSHLENRLDLKLDTQTGIKLSDVIFSLQRLQGANSPRSGDYRFIKKIYLRDKNTISFSLDPSVTETQIKEKLALPFASILNQEKFESSGDFVSFGTYQILDWKKNEYLSLELNDDTKTRLPKRILIRILPQSTTSLFLYKKSEIDALKLTDFLLSIPEADKEHTILKQGRSIQYVAINHKNHCFDLNFRYALNFAIPRELIIQRLLEGKADAVVGPIPKPFYESIFSKTKETLFHFDRELARKYLKNSACYPKILDTTLEFRMRGDDENQAKGRAIVQALHDIGLKINIKGMEKAPLYKENGEGKGDLTLLTWYADYPSVWNFLDPLFHIDKKGNGGNRAHYENPLLSKRLNAKENLESAQNIIAEIEKDAPWIFLWSIQENYLVSDKFIRYEALSDYL
jgi:peptide/nickel transport system substrate-binding protein